MSTAAISEAREIFEQPRNPAYFRDHLLNAVHGSGIMTSPVARQMGVPTKR
jgi:hypothetical protein